MAASTLSFGMFALRAFCSARRSAALLSGLGPPAFTAMAISLLIRVNCFAMRCQRANIVALRVSKMRPMRAPGSPAASRQERVITAFPPAPTLAHEPRKGPAETRRLDDSRALTPAGTPSSGPCLPAARGARRREDGGNSAGGAHGEMVSRARAHR